MAKLISILLLALLCVTCAVPPSIELSFRGSVVIFDIDTLRADHLGCYGYHRLTSPQTAARLRSLAKRWQDSLDRRGRPDSETPTLEAEMVKNLRALGYLQ